MSRLARLKRRNQRQKSDVASKLVSMCLHELSARILDSHPELRVETDAYAAAVGEAFGENCAFCASPLPEVPHLEHLEGMNRARGGLHVAGNVVLSCQQCNYAKRRDDQRQTQAPGTEGWDSFLSHDGSGCEPKCTTCRYWRGKIPDDAARTAHLAARRRLIAVFRSKWPRVSASSSLEALETLYRNWQEMAQSASAGFAAGALQDAANLEHGEGGPATPFERE